MEDSKEKTKRHAVSTSEDPKISPDSPDVDTMHHREITLPDGRYMIFYTFGDEGLGCSAQSNDQGNV